MRFVIAFAAAAALAAPALAAGQAPFTGTWTWDAGRSTATPTDPSPDRSEVMTVTRADTHYVATMDSVDHDGAKHHTSWNAEVGGPPVAVEGSRQNGKIQYTKLTATDLDLVYTGDKESATGHCTLSADGKTSTCTGTYTDAGGHHTYTDIWTKP